MDQCKPLTPSMEVRVSMIIGGTFFASKIKNFNPRCVFLLFYTHVSHPTSRKRKCQYFIVKAKCKIPTCQVGIKLSISKKSIVRGVPTVNVTTSGNLIHKKTQVLYSINLSGEKRLQVAKSIADVGVDNYYYQQFERIFIDATGSPVSSKNLSEK